MYFYFLIYRRSKQGRISAYPVIIPPKRKTSFGPKKHDAKRMAIARTQMSDEEKAVQREKDKLRKQIQRYNFLMIYKEVLVWNILKTLES